MQISKIYLLLQTHKKLIYKIFLLLLIAICLCFLIINLTSCGNAHVVENASVTTSSFSPTAHPELQKAMDVIAQQNTIIEQKNEQIQRQEKLAKIAEEKLQDELKQKQIKEQKHQVALQAVKKYRAEKEILQEKLNAIIEHTKTESLDNILKNKESGGHGIYIIHNEVNNKFYVGQAKQCIKRIKQHFSIEDLAKDYLKGDHFSVQIIPSRDLPKDYELSHMEKAAIEMFKKDKQLYNKTDGNLVYVDDDLDFSPQELTH